MKKFIYLFSMIVVIVSPLKLKAESATININATPKSTNVGEVITASITVTSSSKLGRVDYIVSYTNNLTLISGEEHKVDYNNSGKTSATYTYKFKATNGGQGKIYIDEKTIEDPNGIILPTTVNSAVINIAGSAASATSKHFLSELSVKNYSLNPKFDKGKENYSIIVPKDTSFIEIEGKCEETKDNLIGAGKINLNSEEENVLEIKCTNDSGTIRSYFINVLFEGKDIITVKIDGKKYTVLKDQDLLKEKAPENYKLDEIKIEDTEVPALKGAVTKLTLLLLEDSEGNTYLFEYNKKSDSYNLYKEINIDGVSLYVMKPLFKPTGTTKTKVILDGQRVLAFESSKNKDIYYVYAIDLDTGHKSWYKYNDSTEKIEMISTPNELNNKTLYIICGGSLLILLIILSVLLKKKKKRKRRKRK